MSATKTREIKTPDAPATSKQTMMIFRLGGGDVRPQNLTMQQASDRIKELMRNKDAVSNTSSSASSSPDFQKIFNEATEAANTAGDKWWMERCDKPYDPSKSASFFGMLDLCGFASLVVKDKRTAFYKWYTQQNKKEGQFFISHSIYVPHKYQARQDLGLREACVKAAADVFHQNGIKGLSVECRLD